MEQIVDKIWNTPTDCPSLNESCGSDNNETPPSCTKRDLLTLKPGMWLNDEVINRYMELIMLRANASTAEASSPLPRVYAFKTFFMQKLEEVGGDYTNVCRWTRRADLFAHEIIILPVNPNKNHWTVVVVDFACNRIDYYDSLGDDGIKYTQLCR